MKKLMNRAGLLAAAFALALAVALALNAAGQTPEVAQAQTTGVAEVQSATCDPKSHDRDGNGLIDICTPAQLNAMRYDLNGDGIADGDPLNTAYTDHLSCRQETNTSDTASCKGYELMEDISLDDLPVSWTAISPRGAVFDGNGFSIRGLRGNNGLFGNIDPETVVKNVDVVDAEITVAAEQGGAVGVLADVNRGTIIGSYVTGTITRKAPTFSSLGGLVGRNGGKIYASVAAVNLKVTSLPAGSIIRVGGFVGKNDGDIHRSYAYGNVINSSPATGADSGGRFKAHGFAVNNTHADYGNIHSSLSYGDKIVINGPRKSKDLATFASGLNSESNSCELADEWEFTCPTSTPTPTN